MFFSSFYLDKGREPRDSKCFIAFSYFSVFSNNIDVTHFEVFILGFTMVLIQLFMKLSKYTIRFAFFCQKNSRNCEKEYGTAVLHETYHWGLLVIGGAGAYSSQKGLAPWRGQCHQPRVGVPTLRPAGLTSWAAPPAKKSSSRKDKQKFQTISF